MTEMTEVQASELAEKCNEAGLPAATRTDYLAAGNRHWVSVRLTDTATGNGVTRALRTVDVDIAATAKAMRAELKGLVSETKRFRRAEKANR